MMKYRRILLASAFMLCAIPPESLPTAAASLAPDRTAYTPCPVLPHRRHGSKRQNFHV